MENQQKTYMTYEDYLVNIRQGIVTSDGHCPVTPLLLMLQGRWKSQIMYEMCIHDTVRFGQLKRALPGITNTMLTEMGRDLLPVFYAIMNWGFRYEDSLYKKENRKEHTR